MLLRGGHRVRSEMEQVKKEVGWGAGGREVFYFLSLLLTDDHFLVGNN